jgi:hypothetical protein
LWEGVKKKNNFENFFKQEWCQQYEKPVTGLDRRGKIERRQGATLA